MTIGRVHAVSGVVGRETRAGECVRQMGKPPAEPGHVIGDGDFFVQEEDVIRDLVRSRGLGDVYKRQSKERTSWISRHWSKRLNCKVTSRTGSHLSLIHI